MMESIDHEEGPRTVGGEDRHEWIGDNPTWIDSRVLFGCRDEVVIRHGDQMYRLKITRHGKLILNK